jgi:hypothetical protein
MLREDHRLAGLADLLDELGRIRAELRDRLNVTGGLELGHGASGGGRSVQNNVQTSFRPRKSVDVRVTMACAAADSIMRPRSGRHQ